MASGEKGPLDDLYKNKIVAIILTWVCCILGLVAFFTAKDPESKGNAKLGIIINVAFAAIVILFYVVVVVLILGAAGAAAK